VRARYPSRTLSINARRKSTMLSISEAEFLISSSQATCRGARFPPTTNLGTFFVSANPPTEQRPGTLARRVGS
jgi:hypothetical protein